VLQFFPLCCFMTHLRSMLNEPLIADFKQNCFLCFGYCLLPATKSAHQGFWERAWSQLPSPSRCLPYQTPVDLREGHQTFPRRIPWSLANRWVKILHILVFWTPFLKNKNFKFSYVDASKMEKSPRLMLESSKVLNRIWLRSSIFVRRASFKICSLCPIPSLWNFYFLYVRNVTFIFYLQIFPSTVWHALQKNIF